MLSFKVFSNQDSYHLLSSCNMFITMKHTDEFFYMIEITYVSASDSIDQYLWQTFMISNERTKKMQISNRSANY